MIELTISVKDNVSGYLSALPAQTQKALGMARRDALKTLRGYAAKLTAEQNYITQSEVKKATAIEFGGLHVRGGMRGLEKFKLSPKRPGKRRYVLSGAVRRGGMKPLGSNAFLMRKGGSYFPFARTSRKRYPVKRLYGPSIPQLAGSENNLPLIEAKSQELFESRAKYWLNRLTGGKK